VSPQLGENPEHCHGIRTARNAQADPVARPHHGVPVDAVENTSVKVFFHPKKPLRRIFRRARAQLGTRYM